MYLSYYPIGTAGHRAMSQMPQSQFAAYGQFQYAPQGPFPGSANQPPPYLHPHVYPAPYAAPDQAFAPQEPVSGGISAVLEYDPQTMAAFMSWCLFGMLNQTRTPTKDFEDSVVLVLHATRLPRSTILVALEYINQRYARTPAKPLADLAVFLVVTIALVLANKFNDDNTFTNRSWSGATSLKIELLNAEEAAWLRAVNWKLSVVNYQANIHTLEECWKTWLQNAAGLPAPTAASSQYYPLPTLSADGFRPYSSIPSSPLYGTLGAASYGTPNYGYQTPSYTSPVKYAPDWGMLLYQYGSRGNPYAHLAPHSIWAPSAGYPALEPSAESAYYRYPNTFYNCLAC